MTKRREFSNHVRLAAWRRCKERCEWCTCRIVGVAEYHHLLADGLGGEPTLDNCQVLCKVCHRKFTDCDVKMMAKADRAAKRAAGIRPKSRFQNSRDGKWKTSIGGRTELRNP